MSYLGLSKLFSDIFFHQNDHILKQRSNILYTTDRISQLQIKKYKEKMVETIL